MHLNQLHCRGHEEVRRFILEEETLAVASRVAGNSFAGRCGFISSYSSGKSVDRTQPFRLCHRSVVAYGIRVLCFEAIKTQGWEAG
jgi:hypothetical protein